MILLHACIQRRTTLWLTQPRGKLRGRTAPHTVKLDEQHEHSVVNVQSMRTGSIFCDDISNRQCKVCSRTSHGRQRSVSGAEISKCQYLSDSTELKVCRKEQWHDTDSAEPWTSSPKCQISTGNQDTPHSLQLHLHASNLPCDR